MDKIKGLRIDPGFYFRPNGTPIFANPHIAAQTMVSDAASWGVNTLFIFAYSPDYGPVYHTNWTGTQVTNSLGQLDFLREIVRAANAHGIKVIASFRMNWESRIASQHPTWRSTLHNGTPYKTYLSAWNPAYQAWFKALLQDFVAVLPDIDGLEACEGNVLDCFETGQSAPDYSQAAHDAFVAKFHRQPVMDEAVWLQFRADGMTQLHSILHSAAAGRATYAIHDLPSAGGATSNLFDLDAYAKACGFDFKAVSALGFHMIQGAIWQQRRRDTGDAGFNPAWTTHAATLFRHLTLPGHGKRLTHVEVTPFFPNDPVGSQVKPTDTEFHDALLAAGQVSDGVTVYSYHQLKDLNNNPTPYATAFKSALAAIPQVSNV